MESTLRKEEEKDIEQVRVVVRAAFPSDAESRLVDILRAHGKDLISLVAVHGEDVLGHILFSPVSMTPTPSGNAKGIGLAPVAVHPDCQSQGIGSALIREGLRLCKEQGFDYCVVLGSPEYYRRFGFERASQFDVQNEYGVDHEFMLTRFTDCVVGGLVQYAPEFADLSV